MTIRRAPRFVVIAVCLPLFVAAGAPAMARELVTNPGFEAAAGSALAPGWKPWKPGWQKAACRMRCVDGGLRVDAEDPYAVGGVVQEIQGIDPGQAYAITAASRLRQIHAPVQSLLVRMIWTRGDKLLHPAGVLIKGPVVDDGAARFADVLVAPVDADGARLSLEVKWPGAGSVLWESVSVKPTASPAARKVRIGTVFLRPRNSTPTKNLDLWCEQIDAAGKLKLDIDCHLRSQRGRDRLRPHLGQHPT